jgi:hypothetical protein
MSIRSRLVSLERAARSRGCGPGCPPRPVLVVRDRDFYDDADPSGERREPPAPAPCPRCGRAAEPTVVHLVYDPSFFGNAERIKELTAGTQE